MAVSINEVYKRVLAIANKEQRGHITPLEFNNLATQVQLEIFEQYFYDINFSSKKPGNSTEHSDVLHILEEKIAPFRVNDQSLFSATELITTSTFTGGTGAWTVTTGTGNNSDATVVANANNNFVPSLKLINDGTDDDNYVFVTQLLTAGKKFRISVEVSYANDPDANDSVGMFLQVSNQGSNEDGFYDINTVVKTGDVFTFDFETLDVSGAGANFEDYTIRVGLNEDAGSDNTEIHFSKISIRQIDNQTLANDVYRLGEVTFQRTGIDAYPIPVQEVDKNEMTLYNLSPLARPTQSNPAYYRSGIDTITLFPEPATTTEVKYSYIKKPTTPKWAYTLILNPGSSAQQLNPTDQYKPQWSPANSVDFELHESEESRIVMRILELAGVVNKEPDIVQYADRKNREKTQLEKL
tara:strand:+ start:688 stop:1920 length:1233 start_codon:yes stop_codon:yes gene_type:complete